MSHVKLPVADFQTQTRVKTGVSLKYMQMMGAIKRKKFYDQPDGTRLTGVKGAWLVLPNHEIVYFEGREKTILQYMEASQCLAISDIILAYART